MIFRDIFFFNIDRFRIHKHQTANAFRYFVEEKVFRKLGYDTVYHTGKKKVSDRPRWDSNPQSSDSKSDAVSIGPRGRTRQHLEAMLLDFSIFFLFSLSSPLFHINLVTSSLGQKYML